MHSLIYLAGTTTYLSTPINLTSTRTITPSAPSPPITNHRHHPFLLTNHLTTPQPSHLHLHEEKYQSERGVKGSPLQIGCMLGRNCSSLLLGGPYFINAISLTGVSAKQIHMEDFLSIAFDFRLEWRESAAPIKHV